MPSIFEGFLSTSEVQEALSERSFLAAMLRFEASLARAQASVGLIPDAAAQSIIGTCRIELFDVPKIVRESGQAGNIATPLVKSLQETVGIFNLDAAAFVHWGCTSQDAIDSALALVTRQALTLIDTDVDKAIATLLALADQHAATPMLARTLLQPASVTSFGLTCASWAASLVRSRQRLSSSARQALSLQLGGAVGTLAHMQGLGPQVRALMAADLNLNAPLLAWHTQRDEWVALGCELGLLVGSLGKIAKDVSLMSQYEVGELSGPADTRQHGAPVPPARHQHACMVALAAAQRAPQRVAALLASMPQEHEQALGNWQAAVAEWPALLMSVHGAARAIAQALPGLQVETQRMLANLDSVRAGLPAKVADEWFHPGLVNVAAELAQAQINALRAPAPPLP